MSDRPEDIARRLAGLEDIGQVVGALRAIASGNAARARDAMQACRRYGAIVTDAIAQLLPPTAATPAGTGLVLVIGAAQGFSGAYPARIAAAAQQAARDGAALLVLGQRTQDMLVGPAMAAVVHRGDLPAHVGQVPALASTITDLLLSLSDRHPGPIGLVAGRDLPGQPVQARRLWPPAPVAAAPARTPPLTNLPPAQLAGALLGEALYALVLLALAEGFRAENQARIDAMARAQSNLRERRVAVQQLYQQARQEQMTTEILDLVAGVDAGATAH